MHYADSTLDNVYQAVLDLQPDRATLAEARELFLDEDVDGLERLFYEVAPPDTQLTMDIVAEEIYDDFQRDDVARHRRSLTGRLVRAELV